MKKDIEKAKDSRIITIEDVAREAGVSSTTVSRVINNKEHVKPDKYTRVIQAMDRLGFVANPHARGLAGGRSNIIGVLVPGVSNPYVGALIQGIESELINTPYDLLLYTLTMHNHKNKEVSYVATLSRGLADGLILAFPTNTNAYQTELQSRKFPYVTIDNLTEDDSTSSIRIAYHKGAYDATNYLIDLGHRRIGIIADTPPDRSGPHGRLDGYQAALQAHGILIDPDLIQSGNFTQPSGFSATEALLNLPEPPTAIFAASDLMALGAMEAIYLRGLRIPDDLSLIGFDDIPQASQVHPPLTTMRMPVAHVGRMATKVLIERLRDPNYPITHVELATELVIRHTCGIPRQHLFAR